MARFGVTEQQFRERHRHRQATARPSVLECDRATALLDRGEGLLPLLDDAVRPQVSLFGQGGRAILAAIIAGRTTTR